MDDEVLNLKHEQCPERSHGEKSGALTGSELHFVHDAVAENTVCTGDPAYGSRYTVTLIDSTLLARKRCARLGSLYS